MSQGNTNIQSTEQQSQSQQGQQSQPQQARRQTLYKKIGQYSLIKEIGQGSFARVYKGRTETNGVIEDFAIKMISKSFLREENQELIEKEIDILMKLNHPNIIKLKDFKKTSNNWYLIFEFCELGDLEQHMKEKFGGRFPLHIALTFIQQLSSALAEVRRLKIVHRDLKLANILLTKDLIVKLGDFGFAKHFEEDSLLQSYCGTPITMAPEILKREKYNEKCDIWSLGVIIYQMIFGKPPFNPPKGAHIQDLIALIDQNHISFDGAPITPEVISLITLMLQTDPNKRISFDEFFKHPCVQPSYLASLQDPSKAIQDITEQNPISKVKKEIEGQGQQAIKNINDSPHQLIQGQQNRKNSIESLKEMLQFPKNTNQQNNQPQINKQQIESQEQSPPQVNNNASNTQDPTVQVIPKSPLTNETQAHQAPQNSSESSAQDSQQKEVNGQKVQSPALQDGALEVKEKQNFALELIHQRIHEIIQLEFNSFLTSMAEVKEIASQLVGDQNTEFGENCAWSAILLALYKVVKTNENNIEITLIINEQNQEGNRQEETFRVPFPKTIKTKLLELSKELNDQVLSIHMKDMELYRKVDVYNMMYGNLLHYADYSLLNEFLNAPSVQLKYYRRCIKLCELLQSISVGVFSRIVITVLDPTMEITKQDIQKIIQIAPKERETQENSSMSYKGSSLPRKMSIVKTLLDIQKTASSSNILSLLNIPEKSEQLKIQLDIYQARYQSCLALTNK